MHLVGEAIQSVINQSFQNWELIVVDDGSIDDTMSIVARFSDARIRYIYQENRKLPGARNTGIRASKGEYVAFLDSDDRFLPGKLALQLDALSQHPEYGLVASGWTEIDIENNFLRTHRPWRLGRELELMDWLHGCPFIPSSVLVRREGLLNIGLFDEKQHYVEDWDLWLRLSYAGCRMAWVPGIVCLRTVHEGNMTQNVDQMTNGRLRMFDKFFAQSGLPVALLQQRDRIFAGTQLNAAVRTYGAGADGIRHLIKAAQLDPTLIDGQPPVMLQAIASSALTKQVPNVDQYIMNMCLALPEVSPQLARTPRQMRAMIQAVAAFDEKAQGRHMHARLSAAQAILMDTAWLKNRGLIKILIGL